MRHFFLDTNVVFDYLLLRLSDASRQLVSITAQRIRKAH